MKPLVFVLFLISGMLSAEDAVQYGDCEIKSDNDKMKLVCSAGLKNGIILSCNSDGHFSILLTTREISYTGLPEEWRDHPGIMVGQGFISVIIYIDNIRYIFEEQGYTFAMLWSYRAGSSFYVYNIFHGALLRSALISWQFYGEPVIKYQPPVDAYESVVEFDRLCSTVLPRKGT